MMDILGYMMYVEKYLDQILTKIKPYLRGNGGPIIMVQVKGWIFHNIRCLFLRRCIITLKIHRHSLKKLSCLSEQISQSRDY